MKNQKKKARFVGIPYHVANSAQFASLSAYAVKLLVDLLVQYKGGASVKGGGNNGKLSACWTLMRKRGWRSTATLYRAKKELIDKGFVVVTRQGMKIRGKPTLLAVTWDGISDCGVNYDSGIEPSNAPLSFWCKSPDSWDTPPPLRVVK